MADPRREAEDRPGETDPRTGSGDSQTGMLKKDRRSPCEIGTAAPPSRPDQGASRAPVHSGAGKGAGRGRQGATESRHHNRCESFRKVRQRSEPQALRKDPRTRGSSRRQSCFKCAVVGVLPTWAVSTGLRPATPRDGNNAVLPCDLVVSCRRTRIGVVGPTYMGAVSPHKGTRLFPTAGGR